MVCMSFCFLSDPVPYVCICIIFLSNKIKLPKICNSKIKALAELEFTQFTRTRMRILFLNSKTSYIA